MFFVRFVLTLSALFLSVNAADTKSVRPNLTEPQLLCSWRDRSGIVLPQQSIIIDISLLVPEENSTNWTLNAVLSDLAQPDRPAVTQFSTQIVPQNSLPVSFITPEKEGVYEITLTATQESKQNRQVLGMQFSRQSAPPSTEVRLKFVVLPQKQVTAGGISGPYTSNSRPVGDWTLTDTRDLPMQKSAPPRRYMPNLPDLPKVPDLLKIPDIPRPGKLITELPRPSELLRFGKTAAPQEPLAAASDHEILLPNFQEHFFVQKSSKNPGFSSLAPAEEGKCTYNSWPLDTAPGKPYLVEIEYPANIPQTLGIAVIDQLQSSESGSTGNILASADLHIAPEIVKEISPDTSADAVAVHRLLFWAKSESQQLVLINRQTGQEALFRNIRFSRIMSPEHQEDQRLPKLFEGKSLRNRFGQILKPAGFKQLTGINQSSDWQQIYEGSSRLLDCLSRGGYDGLTLTILSKDIVLYPPDQPTNNPQENDLVNCLELLFQRFNNEGLTLIPAIEFDFLLPSLERLLVQHPGITESMLITDQKMRRYNLLYPAVQQAMYRVVQDITSRFGHHPSFGGIAVVLSPESYAGLPFKPQPPDDYTFEQFQNDTEKELGIPFPDVEQLSQTLPIQQFLERKNIERVRFLQSNPKVWETWVRWRAAKVSGFYANLANQIAVKRSGMPLYLLGGTLLNQPEIQQFCAPTLPKNFTSLQALQLLGFDLPMLAKIDSLHFLRPVLIDEERNYCYDRLDSLETVPFFSASGTLPGVQFVHTENEHFTTTPAHHQSRRRFVKQLAQTDVLMFLESGSSLPTGQEQAMFDLLDTFRRLPNTPFQTLQLSEKTAGSVHQQSAAVQPISLQPLTVRYKNLPNGMIMYIVNDAPYSVEADFFFSADHRCTLSELSGRRLIRSLSRSQQPGTYTWRASLLPYDLLAVQISDENTKIESVSVLRPEFLCSDGGLFKQQVNELSNKVNAARNPEPLQGLPNADFELPSDSLGQISGWQCFGQSFTAQQDHIVAYKEQCSVRLSNNSPEPGTFLSEPLTVPATGRLGISMFVGIPAEAVSLPMSVVLTGQNRGEPFSRNIPIGKTLMPYLTNAAPKNGVRWSQLLVPFDREHLPMDSLSEIRIGIQFWGSGTVWIDDIRVYPVLFSANETKELQKMLVIADQRCVSERYSDLLTQLEGHWTRYLFEHVALPLPQPKVAEVLPVSASESVSSPKQKQTLYQRAKGWFGWNKD